MTGFSGVQDRQGVTAAPAFAILVTLLGTAFVPLFPGSVAVAVSFLLLIRPIARALTTGRQVRRPLVLKRGGLVMPSVVAVG